MHSMPSFACRSERPGSVAGPIALGALNQSPSCVVASWNRSATLIVPAWTAVSPLARVRR